MAWMWWMQSHLYRDVTPNKKEDLNFNLDNFEGCPYNYERPWTPIEMLFDIFRVFLYIGILIGTWMILSYYFA